MRCVVRGLHEVCRESLCRVMPDTPGADTATLAGVLFMLVHSSHTYPCVLSGPEMPERCPHQNKNVRLQIALLYYKTW